MFRTKQAMMEKETEDESSSLQSALSELRKLGEAFKTEEKIKARENISVKDIFYPAGLQLRLGVHEQPISFFKSQLKGYDLFYKNKPAEHDEKKIVIEKQDVSINQRTSPQQLVQIEHQRFAAEIDFLDWYLQNTKENSYTDYLNKRQHAIAKQQMLGIDMLVTELEFKHYPTIKKFSRWLEEDRMNDQSDAEYLLVWYKRNVKQQTYADFLALAQVAAKFGYKTAIDVPLSQDDYEKVPNIYELKARVKILKEHYRNGGITSLFFLRSGSGLYAELSAQLNRTQEEKELAKQRGEALAAVKKYLESETLEEFSVRLREQLKKFQENEATASSIISKYVEDEDEIPRYNSSRGYKNP